VPQISDRKLQRKSLTKLIDELFGIDPRIRFIAIYHGRYIIAGGMRPNLESHDPDDEARDIDLQLEKIGETIRTWQRWFGKLYTLTLRYERVNLVFQPLEGERFLVMSTESELDPSSVMMKVEAHSSYRTLTEEIP
jgi:hypothetical protein